MALYLTPPPLVAEEKIASKPAASPSASELHEKVKTVKGLF